MLCGVGLATLLPRLFKLMVRRRRPDRTIVRDRHRHGIPRSSNPWDSFLCGHAMHLGAIAGPLSQLIGKRLRPFLWPSLLALAASGVLLLAYYVSDVVAASVWGDSRWSRLQALWRTLEAPTGRALAEVAQADGSCLEPARAVEQGCRVRAIADAVTTAAYLRQELSPLTVVCLMRRHECLTHGGSL
jgi:PAP2 superfamily